MPVTRITELDDPRLAPFRHLRDRTLAREDGRFVAEGHLVVRQMIEAGVRIDSLLVADRKRDEMLPRIPPDVPTYLVDNQLVSEIVGYRFHQGVVACGFRPAVPPLDALIGPRNTNADADAGTSTLLVCPKVIDHENLGSILRIAAGFGVTGVLLGEQCVDPYWRRTIRVSMGTVFLLPVRKSPDLAADLARLREADFELVATVCHDDGEPLPETERRGRLALLIGPEDHGLDDATLAHCDRRVTIPMQHGADSLNVAIATAVCLYHFTSGA